MQNPTAILLFVVFGLILLVMYIAIRRHFAAPLIIAAIGVFASLIDMTLIGLDVSSMDSVDSASLPGHHALKRLGMVNLENLMLHGVPDGDYELIAQVTAQPVQWVVPRGTVP